MGSIAIFLIFKGLLVAGVLALAARELALLRRGDMDPEFTRKLVRVFSAAERARPAVQLGVRLVPTAPVDPAAEPTPLQRAA